MGCIVRRITYDFTTFLALLWHEKSNLLSFKYLFSPNHPDSTKCRDNTFAILPCTAPVGSKGSCPPCDTAAGSSHPASFIIMNHSTTVYMCDGSVTNRVLSYACKNETTSRLPRKYRIGDTDHEEEHHQVPAEWHSHLCCGSTGSVSGKGRGPHAGHRRAVHHLPHDLRDRWQLRRVQH